MKKIILFICLLFPNLLSAQCYSYLQGKQVYCTPWYGFGFNQEESSQFPVIRVRVTLHVIQDASGNNNFPDNDTYRIYLCDSVIKWLNEYQTKS